MFDEVKGKKLLLLSGNSATIELIERCHELGIIVYVTDYLEDSPGKKYADKSFMVSTNDVEKVVELARQENVDGILTINIDFLLPYYFQACKEYGYPLNPPASTQNQSKNVKIAPRGQNINNDRIGVEQNGRDK